MDQMVVDLTNETWVFDSNGYPRHIKETEELMDNEHFDALVIGKSKIEQRRGFTSVFGNRYGSDMKAYGWQLSGRHPAEISLSDDKKSIEMKSQANGLGGDFEGLEDGSFLVDYGKASIRRADGLDITDREFEAVKKRNK